MKDFVILCSALEQARTREDEKKSWLHFLSEATDTDKLWAIFLFLKGGPKRIVSPALLKKWMLEESGISLWLFEESYKLVGDLAETLSLIFPSKSNDSGISLTNWMESIKHQTSNSENEKKAFIIEGMAIQGPYERFIFYKLVTGAFSLRVSQNLLSSVLAFLLDKDTNQIAQRLTDNWTPDQISFQNLFLGQNARDQLSRPFSFQKASPLEPISNDLGIPEDWIVEWKWDGMRAQLIKRGDEHFVWLKNVGFVTEKFPELNFLRNAQCEGFVLDGEILVFKNDRALDTEELHKRIKKKRIDKKTLEKSPVVFMAFDLLEIDGNDIRSKPLIERKNQLKKLFQNNFKHSPIKLSEEFQYDSFDNINQKRNDSRDYGAKGVILKRINILHDTSYDSDSWKAFNAEPYSILAVLIYAAGSPGQRSDFFTQFTFGVWNEGVLFPITKTGTGLTKTELMEINQFIKINTVERFGPVRSIKPSLVFEIEFEKISKSTRHKSGLSLQNPRIKSWLKDSHPKDIHNLNDLKAFLI